MEKIRLLVLVICLAGTVTSTSPRRCVQKPVDKEESLQSFTIGNDEFSNSFLYEVDNSNGGSNVMSPFCVLFILAQLALFTIKESHTQLMDALNLHYKQQIRVVFPALIDDFKNQTQAEFSLASKTYVSQSSPLSQNYQYATEKYFDSKAENVDFSNPQGAADTINQFVSERTKGLIPTLVSADMFSPLTELVLVNALYFKGNWTKPFNPSNTKDRNFYLNNIQRPIQVKTMYQQNTFAIGESDDLGARILQMRYKGDFSLYILLPNIVEGLKPMLVKMQDRSLLASALNSLTIKTVQLYLPKFKTESSIDLAIVLPKLNITYIFDKENSGLTGILEKNKPLYVSSGIQKAVIDVNEYGTLAAAATALVVGLTSVRIDPSETVEFNADHPFAYLLRYKNYTLFCGTFSN